MSWKFYLICTSILSDPSKHINLKGREQFYKPLFVIKLNVMYTVMKVRVPNMAENFLFTWQTLAP